MTRTLGLSLALLLGAVPALIAAPVTLYTQPWDGTSNMYASQNDTSAFGVFAQAYDNFVLGQTAPIYQVNWTGEYFNPPAPGTITGFTIAFFADNAGQPGGLLASYFVSGNANETFLGVSGGYPVFTYSANLGPFNAIGGTQYWLDIFPNLGFPPQWGWAPATGGDAFGYQDFFGTRGAITSDLAFTLLAPEPAPYLLAGAGFALLAVRRRRRAA
jgi:hypothetical protein